MSSIAIVTDNYKDTLGAFLRRNLEIVLGGYVDIESYFLDKFPIEEQIKNDIILVMTKEHGVFIRGRTNDTKKIITINRTIKKSEIYKIFSIPSGTRVLVVNDNRETTLEMASLLLHLGVDNLDLIPFDPNHDYYDIKIAITPAERVFVPKHIVNIIDTGHRYIDISTFILIMDMLKIADREVTKRLLEYSETIIPLESGINIQYKQLYIKNLELDSILDITHEGIMLVDNEDKIRLRSKALNAMLDLRPNIAGKPLPECIKDPLLSALRRETLNDELVQYNNRSILVTGRRIEQYGEKSGSCYNFRDITHVRQLEQNLDDRLRAKGFVPKYSFRDVITDSPSMKRCIGLAKKFARSDLPVLISGESGTGKELLAHAIHSASDRASQPFVAFNCAAVPESLIESELFGYEAGSFTGALKGGKPGLFEQANNGSIFLDEIGDMPLVLQAKLLRVLQERQVMRVGSTNIFKIDIRIIAATNQDLEERIREGKFREDLYYRLNVLPLPVPPLRERKEDIMFLLRSFLKDKGRGDMTMAPGVEALLDQYAWPGNIRELNNIAAYISFMAEGDITLDSLPLYIQQRITDFGDDLTLLSSACPDLSAMEVLKTLLDSAVAEKGAGRSSIKASLDKKGIGMTEGKVRRVMGVLHEMGLIESPSGRGGSRITEKGEAFLNWHLNRLPKLPN